MINSKDAEKLSMTEELRDKEKMQKIEQESTTEIAQS